MRNFLRKSWGMPRKKLPVKTVEGEISKEKKSSSHFLPETLTAIKALAACCFTDKEIALTLDISLHKLMDNKKKYQDFASAIEEGRLMLKKKWGKALHKKLDEADMQAIKFVGTHIFKMSAPKADEEKGDSGNIQVTVYVPQKQSMEEWTASAQATLPAPLDETPPEFKDWKEKAIVMKTIDAEFSTGGEEEATG